MTTYFTSDLHVGHQNIIKFSSRPFADLEEMHEKLIANWNSTVGDDDVVWVLGDVCMGHIAESFKITAQLKGRKILLSGNHDRTWAGYGNHYRASAAQKKVDWAKRYKEEGGFAAIYDGRHPVQYALPVDDVRVLLDHFPYDGDHTADERYIEWRPKDEGNWLLHGHIHEEWKVRGRQINVGVDVWDYRPVAESTLADIILGHGVDSDLATV